MRTLEQKTRDGDRREGHGLTENVDPAVRKAVHASSDGVLVAHIQLFDLQGPAQGPTRRLHQGLAFAEVSHGGVDYNRNRKGEGGHTSARFSQWPSSGGQSELHQVDVHTATLGSTVQPFSSQDIYP